MNSPFKKKLDILENDLKEKASISSQTNDTPDVPYSITEPLPPIFGSRLLQKTKIRHISRSLPNISKYIWVKVTDDDLISEAAEEALNKHYDDKIEHFYEEAKARATAIREVYDGHYIPELFNEVS